MMEKIILRHRSIVKLPLQFGGLQIKVKHWFFMRGFNQSTKIKPFGELRLKN